MIDAGVVQSGYNIPAAALMIEDLLDRIPDPSKDEVKDALSGLFIRDGGYEQFFTGVGSCCTAGEGIHSLQRKLGPRRFPNGKPWRSMVRARVQEKGGPGGQRLGPGREERGSLVRRT